MREEKMETGNSKGENRWRFVLRGVSVVFSPGMIPFAAFLMLFTCSYLRIMPVQYRLIVLGMVFVFTLLLPVFCMYLYRKIYKLSVEEASQCRHRIIPFLLVIASYASCLLLMLGMNMPWYLTAIVLAGIWLLTVCTIINMWWRISVHMAGIGAVVGGLASFAMLFGYNPMWWLCIFILIAGLLGTARMTLQGHSFAEVAAGFVLGLLTAVAALHPLTNMFFRLFVLDVINI